MSAGARDDNPGFTLFANDVLAWEPWHWLNDAELGQAFRLIVYATKLGSRLPADHPLITMLDPRIVALCTRREGDELAVVQPVDLPRLMLARETYLAARRAAASKGGKVSAARRRQRRTHVA